jgi:diguanylate cyclase (GGDEF)-like protein
MPRHRSKERMAVVGLFDEPDTPDGPEAGGSGAGPGGGPAALRARLERHRAELEQRLGRSVSFAAAIADFAHVTDELEPALVVSERHYLDLVRRSEVDAKTGLLNFGAFERKLVDEVERAERDDRALSLLMINVDGLKQINDSEGHLAGDDAIRRAVAAVRAVLRPCDVCGRFGGDLLVVAMPGEDGATARRIAGRIVAQARHALAPWGTGVSVGLATRLRTGCNAYELIDAADGAMRASKRRGGGCVTEATRIVKGEAMA